MITQLIHSKNLLATASLALSLAALSSHAQFNVIGDWSEAPAWQGTFFTSRYDIDFSYASAAFPSRNFPTWTSPNGYTVDYFSQSLDSDVSPGTCYEISSQSTGDPTLYLSASSGWVNFADDNAGNSQFRARVFINERPAGLRISPWSPANTNIWVDVTIQKIKATGGSTISSQSCRLSGVPFYQENQNGGLPLY